MLLKTLKFVIWWKILPLLTWLMLAGRLKPSTSLSLIEGSTCKVSPVHYPLSNSVILLAKVNWIFQNKDILTHPMYWQNNPSSLAFIQNYIFWGVKPKHLLLPKYKTSSGQTVWGIKSPDYFKFQFLKVQHRTAQRFQFELLSMLQNYTIYYTM